MTTFEQVINQLYKMDPGLITVATDQHNSYITDFQLKMAYQTESIHLSQNIVSSAVAYLNSLSPNPYGFYLIKTVNDQPIATLLVTFQSHQSWWIQSVYVHEAHRKQGHFTSLFQTVITKAKQANVRKVSLYAESHNLTAIRIYEKLGMHINGMKFYIYDYVLSNAALETAPLQIIQGITVSLQESAAQFVKGKQDVLNVKGEVEGGKWACVKKAEKTIAMGRYFEQFSDWRFGITRYISHLYTDELQNIQFILEAIISQLKNSHSPKVAAVRIIHRDIDLTGLKGGKLQHYDVLQIEIN